MPNIMTPDSCQSPTPGIGSLYTEILWSIFNINADIDSDDASPLETARHTSQVCSSWRNIMLSSSGIWAKILKLSELQVDKDDSPWRQLVMDRTESAALIIKGKFPLSRLKWLLDFVSKYWNRICNLDISATGDEIVHITTTDLEFLNTPSECMKSFHFPRIRFDLQAPWVSNLTSMTIALPFTTTQILECLANMPYLEDVKIGAWNPDFSPDHTATPIGPGPQQISLPYLTKILISSYHTVAADILRRITPNSECSYTISTSQDAQAIHPTRDEEQPFSGLFRRQLHRLAEPNLMVVVHSDSITVILNKGTPEQYFHTQTYDLSKVAEDALIYYMCLFYCGHHNSKSNSENEKVTFVELDIRVIGDGEIKLIFDSVVLFLQSFTSAKTLMLSQQSLFLFTRIYCYDGQIVNEKLFPSLETLIFGQGPTQGAEEIVFPVQPILVNFLNQRRSWGRPLKCLTLGPMVKKLNLDWGFLEEFNDMEVWFTLHLRDGTPVVMKYMCGSGEPQHLDLTEGWEDRSECQWVVWKG